MKKNISIINSNIFYIMKAFAIISVVLSHSNVSNIKNIYLKNIFSIYKPIGVYIFLILAGYFYNCKKYPIIKKLLKDKFKSIGISWIICGLFTYFSNFLLKPFYINFTEIINWLFGNGTYLYYLTNLLLIYIIIYLLPKNKKIYYIFIILNIISILLTDLNILPMTVDSEKIIFSYLNPYLNIFNWIGIFTFGLLLRDYDLFKIKINIKKLIIIIFIVITFVIINKIELTYWNILTPFLSIIFFFIIFQISKKIYYFSFLVNIGKYSYSIYLLHLPFIALVCRFIPSEFAIISTLLVILIVFYIIKLGNELFKFLKLNNFYKRIIGIR